MKKIISLFQRNYDGDNLVRDEVVPGAEWVLVGEGVPTEKIDGTSCMVRDGKLFKRYSCREGKPVPKGFELVDRVEQTHPLSKNVVKLYGWVPVGDGPQDQWHREAWQRCAPLPDGTYELYGPKVQSNPYRCLDHWLKRHGIMRYGDHMPRDFDGLKKWFAENEVEGIVWHHPDGRMVKLKRRDFGFKWPV